MAATNTWSEPVGPGDRVVDGESRSDTSAREARRVLVAGASGGTGRHVLRYLDSSPLVVRGLTSSPRKVGHLEELGADETVVGDLLEPGTAERAVTDCDVVLSAVGTRPIDVYRRGPLVDGEGNENLAIAAADADVRAFVMVSAIGVGSERPGPMGRLFRLVVGPTIREKTRAETAIRESGVRHTILRPGALVPLGPSGDVVVAGGGAGLWGIVSRDSLARLAVAAPFTPDAANRTFEVVRNPLFESHGIDVDWRLP